MKKRRVLGCSGCLGLVATALVALLVAGLSLRPKHGRRVFRPVAPPTGFAVHGIDVSHHQGAIDWPAVAASGRVDFAFVKATEGGRHVDRRFRRNWAGARAAGLPVGAYHFYSACRGGEEQARHFVAQLGDTHGMLPPVVDVEEDRRCNRGERLGRLGPEVGRFLQTVEAALGVRPLLYTSAAFDRRYLPDVDARRWIAAYTRAPRGTWSFWQYSDRGRVPGILGPVDRNVFRGSNTELQGLRVGQGGGAAATRAIR